MTKETFPYLPETPATPLHSEIVTPRGEKFFQETILSEKRQLLEIFLRNQEGELLFYENVPAIKKIAREKAIQKLLKTLNQKEQDE